MTGGAEPAPAGAPANESLATLPCFLVNKLTSNTDEQCKFIIDNDCLEDEATLDYVHLVYCELGLELRYAAVALVVFLVIILFLNLSAVADEFLCPSLLAVAKNLRMSDSLAGVTLVAFGNGCPDIFASLAAASSNRPELIVGELLGAGIFCTSIVAGLIFIHSDFKLACRPVLRDATFYLLAVYLIWLYCWNETITFYGALAFIVIYVVYLVVALTGQAVHSRLRGDYPIADAQLANKLDADKQLDEKNWFKWREESLRRRKQAALSGAGKEDKQCLAASEWPVFYLADCARDGGARAKDRSSSAGELAAFRESREKPARCSCVPLGGHSNEAFAASLADDSARPPVGPIPAKPQEARPPLIAVNDIVEQPAGAAAEWDEFLARLNPIDARNWAQMRLTSRLVNLLRAPILFATILTIPVVNNDKKNHNWNRLLNSLHCVTVPGAVLLACRWLPDDELRLGLGVELPIRLAALAPGFALAALVYRTSNPHRPPAYHACFAYCGFLMSVVWIYFLANEIISLLKTFGIMFGMSDTAIGLGVLAWGNSLGDIVANLSLAEAGYPRMALGASIGAPLLNLLLGFGLAFSVHLAPGEATTIRYTPTVTLLCATLAAVLCSLMLSTMAPPNKSKKGFGYLLIGCYALYFLLAVCIECQLLNF